MKKIKLLLIFCTFLTLLSCEESDNIKSADPEILTEALVNLDSDALKTEMDKLTFDLKPDISSSDSIGHSENLNKLIERLNSQSYDLDANLFCYACIKTNPLQSEISITVDSLGTEVCRIIDLLTINDRILSYRSVHNCF